MQQGLIILGGWLVSITVAYTVHCFKNKDKERIEMMNVRSRIRKIDRLNKADKENLF